MTVADKAAAFQELHARPGAFVIPNPWDVGTARILAGLGFEALATTSAGLAHSLGRRDGEGLVTRDETLQHAAAIVDATRLPVSADLQEGFGDDPDSVARTIRDAGAAGLVGGSIEDAMQRPDDPIYQLQQDAERVVAAAGEAGYLPLSFVLTDPAG